jgi:hypothetical protein
VAKVIFTILAFSVSIAAQSADVAQLGWITGCWESASATRSTTERWGPATSNMLVGVSQTVKDGKTTSFEFLRIVSGDKGPSYIARPSTAKEDTEFKFLRASKSEIIFENLGHDFPQRIIYRSEGPDGLFARVEGEVGGKVRGTDFKMKRVKC